LCYDGRPHREVRGRPPRQRCAPCPRSATDRGYIAPESDRAAIISELIRLLDGPAQREAKRLSEVALSEATGVEEEDQALGGTTGFLYVATPFRPDWIEAICGGCDPDQHSGSIEWIIVMAMLVVTLAMLGGLPWVKDRQ
jgi:hypothetical protein